MSKTVVSKAVMLGLAVLAFAPSASALPEGFRESARLTKIARALSVPDARVYCATSDAAWAGYLATQYPEDDPLSVDELTMISTREMKLSPRACRPMEQWLRGKRVNLPLLGRSLSALTHGTIHLRGERDEAVAECEGWRMIPTVARGYFGIKKPATLRPVMLGANIAHLATVPEYRAIC